MTAFGKQKCLSSAPGRQQYKHFKITHRILACNEWINNIKIKICNTCLFFNDKDTISHFLIDCNSNKFLGIAGLNGGKQ